MDVRQGEKTDAEDSHSLPSAEVINLDCPVERGFVRAEATGSSPFLLFELLLFPDNASSVGTVEALPPGEGGWLTLTVTVSPISK